MSTQEGPTTTREALARIILGESDALLTRVETLQRELPAVIAASVDAALSKARDELSGEARRLASTSARDAWSAIGAVAAKAATEAVHAALAGRTTTEGSPHKGLAALVVVGLSALLVGLVLGYLLHGGA